MQRRLIKVWVPLIIVLLGAGSKMVSAAQSSPSPQPKLSRSQLWSVFGYDPTPDFRAYNPQYKALINKYKDEVAQLQKELYRQARAGRKTQCLRQVFVEAHWLVHYTAQFERIEKRLQTLRALLQQPADPADAGAQSPLDGSYNACSEAWFYKLDATCDQLVVMQYEGTKPKYPLRFLDRINSPQKLRAYLDSVLISDVARTGEDTRYELNLGGTDLVRLVLGTLPSGYAFQPGLKATMLDYLDNKWQDPQTGFWGCWYKTKQGIRKTADLSATFHIVHYRKGQVKRWPQIIKTVLAMQNLEYPFGWLQEGQMSDHHNYDVVTLFHYGWSYMTPPQRLQAKAAIRQMLNFCLTKSLRADGSFNMNDENTIGESFEFPALFLYEIGYFNKANRFWTNETFPQAKAIAQRIAKKIKALDLTDPESQIAQLIVENAD